MSFACCGILLSALLPKAASNYQWIDVPFLPPLPFLSCGVDLMVVDGAKRNGELIADL